MERKSVQYMGMTEDVDVVVELYYIIFHLNRFKAVTFNGNLGKYF